jgi:hypothetical protein
MRRWQRRFDGGAVKARLPITTSRVSRAPVPGAVVIGLDPGADGLDRQAHRLARDGGEALEPQDVVVAITSASCALKARGR